MPHTEKTLIVPLSQLITHHGDVCLLTIDALPAGAKKVAPKPLALGENSGHRHIAVAERENTVEFYEDADGRTYLVNTAPMKVRHEIESGEWTGEHMTLKFNPGIYAVRIQRVRDPYLSTISAVHD